MQRGMKFLVQARKQAGLSRYAVARIVRQTDQQLKRLEDQGKYFTPQFLRALRVAVGLTWEELGALIDAEYAQEPKEAPKKAKK